MDRSWPALIVNEVSKKQIRWNQEGRIDIQALPIELVYVSSEEDVSKMAVLSWRWDTKCGEISHNIVAAVLYARHTGIQYLFIDTISIDQSLAKESLIEEVAAFSQLYANIPAIQAYEENGENGWSTTRRPWILHELRLIKLSPYKAVPVRHSSPPSHRYHELTNQLLTYRAPSFFQSAIFVLLDLIHMTDITDFRFLLPSFAKIIPRVQKEMSRSDYLLTVAILSGLDGSVYANETHQRKWLCAPSWTQVENIEYARYTFQRAKKMIGVRYNVLLDGEKIGEWGSGIRLRVKELTFVENAEELILTKLGVSQEKCNALAQGGRLVMSSRWSDLLPPVRFAFVDLEQEQVKPHTLFVPLTSRGGARAKALGNNTRQPPARGFKENPN